MSTLIFLFREIPQAENLPVGDRKGLLKMKISLASASKYETQYPHWVTSCLAIASSRQFGDRSDSKTPFDGLVTSSTCSETGVELALAVGDTTERAC
ncbi:MAG: hypothetical protein AAFY20_06135 [Cyanobacteria bacterium J06639_14]